MSDRSIKEGAARVPCPTFDTVAFTTPKPLSEAKVALVSSASLHHQDDADFGVSDAGYPAVDEAKGLRPAYDRAVAQFGNRTGAVRLLDADAIPTAIEAFIRVAEGRPWKEAGIPGVPARVSQDIRGYYETAALAIAGHTPAAWAGLRWFRDQTKTGEVIRKARDAMRDAGVQEPLWRFLLPLDS